MIADQHSLLKQSRIWTSVAELSSLLIAHVVDLAIGLSVSVIAGESIAARETRLGDQTRRLLLRANKKYSLVCKKVS